MVWSTSYQIKANNNIQPTALFDDVEDVEFPEYSNVRTSRLQFYLILILSYGNKVHISW